MKFKAVLFTKEEQYIKKFLQMPKKLYYAEECMQDKKTERQLLLGKHVLSHYFTVQGILILDEKEEAVARCLVTCYPEEEAAYLGFYECVENSRVSSLLFRVAEQVAKGQGKQTVTGPLDASFWIRYRLKTNKFQTPYTGEPYNKEYYGKQFQEAGYQIAYRYQSNCFGTVPPGYQDKLYQEILLEKQKEGYEFFSPSPRSFGKNLQEIYRLIMELYGTFPAFHHITWREFKRIYGALKYVLDYSMVKLVRKESEIVGFLISVPNYHNLTCGKKNLWRMLKILQVKHKPGEYVMLYIGVDGKHKGLGKALSESIKCELQKNQAASIGALIREGKEKESYFQELVTDKYEYVLLQKALY